MASSGDFHSVYCFREQKLLINLRDSNRILWSVSLLIMSIGVCDVFWHPKMVFRHIESKCKLLKTEKRLDLQTKLLKITCRKRWTGIRTMTSFCVCGFLLEPKSHFRHLGPNKMPKAIEITNTTSKQR